MKRIGLFLFVVILTASIAGCGGGGSSDYDFNGTWQYSERVIAQRCIWNAVTARLRVIQSGIDCTVQEDGSYVASGSCNPKEGSIVWNYRWSDGVFMSFTGTALDGETIQGTSRRANGRCFVDTAWTMELLSR